MNRSLNWAVLGTGVIANEMAQALQKMGKSLYAVGNRTHEKAVKFAETYGVHKVYDCIDAMFKDEQVDIIYITSPHNTHYAFMKQALEHGKHLLVEKSITLNSRELDEMIQLAEQNHLILAEAMTIWHMPLYKKAVGYGSRRRIWKSPNDYSKLWQLQRIQYGKSLFQFESGWRCDAGYRRVCVVCRAQLYGRTAKSTHQSVETISDRL